MLLIEALVEDLDPDQLDRMSFSGGGGTLTANQAHALAEKLRTEIIPNIPEGGRMLYDGSTTAEADDGTFHRDNLDLNYSASRGWLLRFAAFCTECGGFEVG